MGRNTWRYCWIGLLLLCACDRTATYQNTIAFDHCCWPVATVLNFSFQIKDVAQIYDICLLVKNAQDYPYQNLYVTHSLEDDARHVLQQALKNYSLFDVKTGKPLGNGFGNIKKHEFLIVTGYQFSHPGLYTLKLEHFKRTDTLSGLQAVGVKVVPSKHLPQ